ncbi:hypothetical protein [Skermanella pratensis]|uniref:hypothetical protein n=1 Tax=Skermanella pratensis TaxID=2233999 RepID=UPI0013018CA9|nr:hypothetical protein [Skermanella pratensis]
MILLFIIIILAILIAITGIAAVARVMGVAFYSLFDFVPGTVIGPENGADRRTHQLVGRASISTTDILSRRRSTDRERSTFRPTFKGGSGG